MKVVVIKVMGGLASQMHKYALGRTLADQHGATLLLDLSWFENIDSSDTPRDFLLDKYNTRYQLADKQTIQQLTTGIAFRKLTSLMNKFGYKYNFLSLSHYVNGISDYDVKGCRPSVYIEGEWFGAEYFKSNTHNILKDLVLKNTVTAEVKKYLDVISNCESVAVHVRRGDFITNKYATKLHYVTGMGYYLKAINSLNEQLNSPEFYVFSDDYEWAAESFSNMQNVTVIPAAGICEDMYLISQCKHQIIANSGYSWFGAWLNTYRDKRVIAPAQWVKDVSANQHIVSDLNNCGFEVING